MRFRSEAHRRAVMANVSRMHGVVFASKKHADRFAEYMKLRYEADCKVKPHPHQVAREEGWHILVFEKKPGVDNAKEKT